jgi:Raf kinase inhibitor-like YbhB/YbcL family protein
MQIKSPVFDNNDSIPRKYTCDGEDISPPLQLLNVLDNTASLTLIVDDPDAPHKTWVHWLLWNISPSIVRLEEGSEPKDAVQGENDFGKESYGGPCPPSGIHRYFFKLYALDKVLELGSGSTKSELLAVMEGHKLAYAELIGRYSR